MRYIVAILILLIAHPALAQHIAPNGKGRMTLQTPHVRHVQVEAIAVGNAASQPTATAFGSASCLQFENNQTVPEYAYFQYEVGIDMIIASGMTVEIDWVPDSGNMTGTDAVGWTIEYGSRAEGEEINGALTTVPVTVDADIVRYRTTHTPFTIDPNDATNPLTHEDHIFFRIGRVNGGVDTFSGTVCITAFEVIYTSDGIPETN